MFTVTAESTHIPKRMCLSCRERQPKIELVRVICQEGHITVDLQGNQPGRGAYVHRNLECIDNAMSKRMFAKALRQRNISDESIEALREFINSTTVVPKPTGEIMSAVQGMHA